MGIKLFRAHKLHHHFFGNFSWWQCTYPWRATAKVLVEHALKDCRNGKAADDRLREDEAKAIFSLFEARIEERLPVEYITREAYYLGRSFYVDARALVPRSLMSARFVDFLDQTVWTNRRVLDLCAGSGCIGISLALTKPDITVDLAEISPDSCAVAHINIDRFGLHDRVRCLESDLFTGVKGPYDLIIANPPYVSTKEYCQIPQEFRKEPRLALESGEDGLDIVIRILGQVRNYLASSGWLIMEIGASAVPRLKKRMECRNFKWLAYQRPGGQAPFLADPCVFTCKYFDLPHPLSA